MNEAFDTSSKDRSEFSLRALLLGLVLVVIYMIAAAYNMMTLRAGDLASNYFPLGVAFPFFVTVAVFNVLLKIINRRWAFRPSELAVVFAMLIAAASIPTSGMTGFLISITSAPFYYASPENGWAQMFHQWIPNWICVHDTQAIRWFFEGIPRGESIPWSPWIRPLFWWFMLLAAVVMASLSMIQIMRKQWVENERIPYPLARVPMDMIEESDSPRLIPKFMRNRVFLAGFAFCVGMRLWNIVGYFVPGFPRINLNLPWVRFGREFPPLCLWVSPLVIGFAYLVNLDISLSVWLFYLLGVIQCGTFTRIGFTIGRGDIYCAGDYWPGGGAAVAWQEHGAFVVMVLWGLWLARRHLVHVWKVAIGKEPQPDDPNQFMSYRTAVFTLLGASLFISMWLLRSGMSPKVLALFLFGVFVCYVGTTRLVIEAGLVFVRPPVIPQPFAIYTLGAKSISPASMTALAFSYAWLCDLIACFMPNAANATRVAEYGRSSKKTIMSAFGLAMIVGLPISVAYTLYLGYQHGAYNAGGWIFGHGARVPFESIVAKMRNPFGTDWARLSFMGIGAIIMIILSVLRYRFTWWPIHPIGFTVGAVIHVQWAAFSMFLGWLIKLIILKVGGARLYQKAWPFFLGLILGHFVGAGISFFVDMIWFPGQGHYIRY